MSSTYAEAKMEALILRRIREFEQGYGALDEGASWDAGWADAHSTFEEVLGHPSPLAEAQRRLKDKPSSYFGGGYWNGWRQAYQELESLLLRGLA